jgi:hypothetical protein
MATNIIITKANCAVELSSQAAPAAAHPQVQIYAAAAVGLIIAVLLWKPFFRDGSGFWECVKYSLKPDWISWWQGEGMEDWWCSLKLGVWLFLSLGCGILALIQLPQMLPSLFGR